MIYPVFLNYSLLSWEIVSFFRSSNAIEMQRVEEDTNVHSEVFEPMLPSPTRSSEFQGSSPRGRGESLVSSQQEDDLLYHQKKLHGDDSLSPNRTRAISVSAVSLYSMSSIDWSTFEKKSAQIKEQRRNDYETMAKRRSRPPLSNPHSIIPTGQRLFLKRPGSLGQNAAAVNKYKRLSLQPYRTSETPYPKALHCGDELQDRAISAAMLARTNRSSVCSTGTSQKSSNRESPGWDLPSDDNLSSIPSIISIDSVPPKSNKSPPMRSLRSSSMDQNYESRNDAINIHRFPKSHSFYNRAPFANNRASYCSTNGEISEVLENGISRTSFDTNLEPCGTPPINYDTSNISFARINSSNGPSTPACGGVGGFGGRQVKQKPPLPNLKFSAAENIQPSSIITYQNHSPPLPSPGMYEEDSSMFLQHSRATSASSPHLSHKNLQLENNLNQDPIKSRRGKFFQSKPEIPQILNLDRTSHMAWIHNYQFSILN